MTFEEEVQTELRKLSETHTLHLESFQYEHYSGPDRIMLTIRAIGLRRSREVMEDQPTLFPPLKMIEG